MNSFRRMGWVRAMVAACALLLCATAQAQVLDQVPENASVVVKFKNLQAVNTKFIALAQKLGLGQQPPFTDPMGMIMEESGVKNGIDKAGDLAIVVLHLENTIPGAVAAPAGDAAAPAPQRPMDPLVMVLLPITDYQGLLGNFVNNRKEGELDVVHFKDNANQDIYVANWGKYAALSDNKDALQKGTGLKPGTAIAKEMDSKDVTVFVNIKALSAFLLPEFRKHKAEILESVNDAIKNNPGGPADMAPVAQAVVTQIMAGAEHFLGECSGAVLSGNINDEGTSFAAMADFRSDTYLGKFVQGIRNVETSFTVGMPEGKYLVYGGVAIDSAQATQVIDDALGPIMAALVKASPDKAKVASDYLQALRSVMSNTQTESAGMLAPTKMGQGGLLQVLGVLSGDADKISQGQTNMLNSTQDLLKLLTGAGATPFKITSTLKPDAKTIGGVSFTQFEQKIEGGENDPAAMQAQAMMSMMYGPGGASAMYGKVDDKHLLSSVCVDDATLAAAITAIKGGADPLGKLVEVQMVNKNLPQKRNAAIYLSMDVLANTVVDAVGKFGGMQLPPLQLKPNLPPVGFTFGSEGSAYRAEGFVPTEMLENLVGAVMQMQMHNQPANGGGAIGM